MDIPTEIKGEDRRLWKKLFVGFRPKSQVEIEMAKRYLVWFRVFENEKAVVVKGNTVTTHSNKTQGTSASFEVLTRSEGEMRRLWEQLKDSFVTTKEAQEDEGRFGSL